MLQKQNSPAASSPLVLKPLRLAPTAKCTLGCPVLDSVLQGGIPCGSITELVGVCGSAKTQFCLQLLLSAQLPPCHGGLGASSIYIYTESYFPSRRLQQLAKGFVKSGKLGFPQSDSSCENRSDLGFDNVTDPCDNIFVQGINSVEELSMFLDQIYPLLARQSAMPVKVIVIDSIAALFRSDFDNNAKDLARRVEWFFRISSKLKQYAFEFGIAVLITNQVVDFVEQEVIEEKRDSVDAMLAGSTRPLFSEGRRVIPALGIGWSHCVNTRLFLSRLDRLDNGIQSVSKQVTDSELKPQNSVLQHLESELTDDFLLSLSSQRPPDSDDSVERFGNGSNGFASDGLKLRRKGTTDKIRRTLQVVFSPYLPASSCDFVVETYQVHGVARLPVQGVFTSSCDSKVC